ncbi:MAG: hypothetical protein MMC23_000952 [Stictis urceolatum]|nr:hypothetical protein [Stictis urceolata]
MIALRRDYLNFSRQAEQKIGKLKEVIEAINQGKDVDVEEMLGTGDPEREKEWEEVLQEIQLAEDEYLSEKPGDLPEWKRRRLAKKEVNQYHKEKQAQKKQSLQEKRAAYKERETRNAERRKCAAEDESEVLTDDAKTPNSGANRRPTGFY